MKFAKRRDGEVYASIASDIHVEPRSVNITLPDGKRKKANLMETVIDNDTGEVKVINDLSDMEFDVFADISPSFSSQKEATIERLGVMTNGLPPGDPMRLTLMLKQMALMDGVEFEDVREYANQQLLLQGVRQPNSPEEEKFLAEKQAEQNQPDPQMVYAQAEMLKGQAAQMKEQRELMAAKAKIFNDRAGTEIDAFEAETDRMGVQVDAQEAGAEINYKNIEAFGEQLENLAKQRELADAEFERRIAGAPTSELLRMLSA